MGNGFDLGRVHTVAFCSRARYGELILNLIARIERLLSIISPRNRFDWIEGGLAIGTDSASPAVLKASGVTSIVSVGSRFRGEVSSFEVLYLDIKDHMPPSAEQASTAAEWISTRLRNGQRVFVHCHAGMGRSVTLVTYYLMSRGKSLQEAIGLVRSRHRQSSPTNSQLRFLRESEARFMKSRPPG